MKPMTSGLVGCARGVEGHRGGVDAVDRRRALGPRVDDGVVARGSWR